MTTDERDTHDHGHDHEHPGTTPDVNEAGYYELMAEAMKELLIEKGVVSADDVRRNLEFLDSRDPVDGGRVIAKAWTDPDFKKRLLDDGTAAIKEMGLTMGDAELVVVENTDDVHNMIVCTLCSCYPRTLLGLPPDWYKSRAYRSRTVREPRKVLAEFGTDMPDDIDVRVHDSTADLRFLVIPKRPEGTDDMSEEELATLVTRDSMIGVSVAKSPGA